MVTATLALGLLSVSAPAKAGASVSIPSVSNAPASNPSGKLPSDVRQLCPVSAKPGYASCMALGRTNVPKGMRPAKGLEPDFTSGDGYDPASLQSAYNLAAASEAKGGGQTVAIVDAFSDPTAEADLAAYRSYFELPACTTANGCLTIVNEYGDPSDFPPTDAGWDGEISLDLDMVSAICPNCHILLVEANTNEDPDLAQSEMTAVGLGARYISNSYSTPEWTGETNWDTFYDYQGVAITAASGDAGYGVVFPAANPHVISVGGTSLLPADNSRNWAEIAWTGGGSGCSAYEPKPSWQTDTGCANRTVADVSAVADPNTGVLIYDTYESEDAGLVTGWNIIGGTSVATPIIAAVYALAGTPANDTYPVSYPYAHSSDLYDIVAGTNTYNGCTPAYLCTAGPGYDGPTGLGTPNGVAAFAS
jgi:subtilase family serine protease